MSIEILEVYVFTLKLPDTRLHKFFDILNRFQLGKNQVFILLLRWTVCKTLTKQAQRHKTATSKLVSKKELNLKINLQFVALVIGVSQVEGSTRDSTKHWHCCCIF